VKDQGVLTLLLALALSAHSPSDAVHRFVERRSPEEACAQLAPHYRHAFEQKYGPCEHGITRLPKASHLQILRSSIIGEIALVDASYQLPNGPVNARFTLERIKGVWLITGAR
jgi:hypothetical protein